MTTIDSTDNGVNVQALLDARETLKGAPEAAQFTWRSTTRWENGVHSTSTVKNFFGLGAEQTHKAESTFTADHPEVFTAWSWSAGQRPYGTARCCSPAASAT